MLLAGLACCTLAPLLLLLRSEAHQQHHFTHVFAPYIVNDEFKLVAQTWKLASLASGLSVDHLCLIQDDAHRYLCPSFARAVPFARGIANYKQTGNLVPSYGEIFKLAKTHGTGKYVLYSNADIALAPEFFPRVWAELEFDYSTPRVQLELLKQTREEYYEPCVEINGDGDNDDNDASLCLMDSLVYFGNLGGRVPVDFPSHLAAWFARQAATIDLGKLYKTRGEVQANALTITRRQLPQANATVLWHSPQFFSLPDRSRIHSRYLGELFEQGEDHPGNDLFLLPRHAISPFLQSTPFTHLRPAGFLVEDIIKHSPELRLRKIQSTPKLPLSFHVGSGTDEFAQRAAVQPRQVLFEAAHFFHSTGTAREKFRSSSRCHQDARYYRRYGTFSFCSSGNNYCRGAVRWACTQYMSRVSREALQYRRMCRKLASRSRELQEPFCSLCNVLEETEAEYYTCNGLAEECQTFACVKR